MIGREFLQAGSFNVRLSVEEPVETPDGYGGFEETWTPAFSVWARLVPVKSILSYPSPDGTMEVTHWIILRKRDDLCRDMRFVSSGGARRFEIDTLHDPDETGRYWLAQVRELEVEETT